VNQLRERQKRNFMATLFLSQGIPMLRAGDELSHTQQGNNNAYCQDNELSWLHWDLDDRQQRFLDFVGKVVELKRCEPVLHRPKFFQGRPIRGTDLKDIQWLDPSGEEMSDEGWQAGFVRSIGVRLNGNAIYESDEQGRTLVGTTLLLLFNADAKEISFVLPAVDVQQRWLLEFDTSADSMDAHEAIVAEPYLLQGRSIAVFRLISLGEPAEAPAVAG
jgi:glycogen operon protein